MSATGHVPSTTEPKTPLTTERKPDTIMSLMTKTWRAHRCPRAWERRSSSAGRQLAAARRLSRKAEQAARQARLALARALRTARRNAPGGATASSQNT